MYLKILLFATLLTLLTITFLKIENTHRQIIVFLVFVIGCLVFTQTFNYMIDSNTLNNNVNGVLNKDITTNSVNNNNNNNNTQNQTGACGCGKNGGACGCGKNGGVCNCGKNGGACGCGKNGGACGCGKNGGVCNCGKNTGICDCGKNPGGACDCEKNGGCGCNGNDIEKIESNLHINAPDDYPPVNCSKKDCFNYNFNYNDLIDKRDTNEYTLDKIMPNKKYNQKDCMNDHSCILKPDQYNMFPK